FFVLLTLILTACKDEETGINSREGENGFSLSYTVTTPESVLSRSAIDLETGEDRINSFYILFFENTSGKTGRFLEAIDAIASYSGPVASSGNMDVTFPDGSSLKNSEEYKMLVCANIDTYTGMDGIEDLITFCDGKTEQQVTYLLQTIQGVTPGVNEQANDSNRISSFILPMSTSLVKPADISLLTIELIRTVSRFDVFNEASGYELVSASLWNAYTEGFVWEGNFTDYTAPRTERYYGVKANSEKEITGSLYAFENYVSGPAQNDKVTTCLIIGLKNLSTNHTEYFRTNVNVSAKLGQRLKRNTAYRTIVKNVYSQGSDTERGSL
ncbi:MAG: hypothetical protein LIP01_04215, partial [Tannerellaceae bacterium]|nr:hypothetical protein [Tannerellaceae bacterium]